MAYPHKYKYGKQEEVMEPYEFKTAMTRTAGLGEPLEHLAFATMLWYCPVRKSEAYERRLDNHKQGDIEGSDVTITKNFVTVDFAVDYGYWTGHRKKHGDQVPPIDIPRSFYGVNDYLVRWIQKRLESKPPRRWSRKTLRYQFDTGRTEKRTFKLRSGATVTKTVPVLEWRTWKERGIWLFPHTGSTTAWVIIKRILGDKYYPHYMRLRKLSAIAGNPDTATLIHLKSVSGIRTLEVLQSYLGVSKKAQTEAMQVE